MELVIRTASGTIIAPWGRNLSQGRLHCDKFPPYYGFLGLELVTGAAALRQVPAVLWRPGTGTCHTVGFVVTSSRSLIARWGGNLSHALKSFQ